MDLKSLEDLISENSDEVVEFGDPDSVTSPTNARIEETENLIGCKLPKSFLWFVGNYGGGEIHGEEIYSIYCKLSEYSVGDISYQTKWFKDRGLVGDKEVVISSNDFGEIFLMDTAAPDRDGEYPVHMKSGDSKILYAANFADFLKKRISGD